MWRGACFDTIRTDQKESYQMKTIMNNNEIYHAVLVMTAFTEGKAIQCRVRAEEGTESCDWSDQPCDPGWNWREYEYRIKPEKPLVKRVRLDFSDFKNVPLIWVSLINGSLPSRSCWLVTFISNDRVIFSETVELLADLKNGNYQWSTDRENWKPFWKEVES